VEDTLLIKMMILIT